MKRRELTARQRREVEYHREHFRQHEADVAPPLSYEILDAPSKRWWNANWQMYAYLVDCDLAGKRVLIVGCGSGDDALRVAHLGAEVFGFDLSPEALSLARARAEREHLTAQFDEMPAEELTYPAAFFDIVIARNILHHVDMSLALAELVRVSKPGALWVINELYSHSITELVRRSRLVEDFLYPIMRTFVFGAAKPYITADERKLDERDVGELRKVLPHLELARYFDFLVNRVLPARWSLCARIDRLLLILLRPIAPVLAGRLLLAGRVSK